jgi:hypothetical protein
MLKNLVKIASDLDSAGFRKEADIVDLIIRRVASELGDQEGDSEDGMSTGSAGAIDEEELAEIMGRN